MSTFKKKPNERYHYTLKNMPQVCRAFHDQVYANQGMTMDIHYFCYIMGLNSALVEDRNKIHRLIYIHNEIKKNIWDALPKKYIGRDLYILENGKEITASNYYKNIFISYCYNHKVLRLYCGTGNREYKIPESYEDEQINYQREMVIKAFQLIHKIKEGKEWDYLIDRTRKKVFGVFLPIYETIRRNVLDGGIEPLRTCPNCNNVTSEKKCPLCGDDTYI